MHLESDLVPFIIFMIVWLILLWKIFHTFRLDYSTGTFLMIFSASFIGFSYHYSNFVEANAPFNSENYRIKKAFFDYSFNHDHSADVNHKLLFEPNKNKVSKNSISYIFYETGDVNSLEVKLNGNSIKLSDKKSPNTYEFKTGNNKNLLTVYFPNDKPKKLDLDITYSIKNALLTDSGLPIYYNTFFPERTDFSFNTNVKGNVIFHYPEDSLSDYGAKSGYWINLNYPHRNSLKIDFKNKLPYEEFPYGKGSDWIKIYDSMNQDMLSLTARVNFYNTKFEKGKSGLFEKNESNSIYSISELKSMTKENNKKFSDIDFVLGVICISFTDGILFFLTLSYPIISSYYRKEKELYFVYYKEKKENS